MNLNFSTMEKVSTLSGMVKYLCRPPRTYLGPYLQSNIEHEFELCANAPPEPPVESRVLFDEFKGEDNSVSKSGQDLLDLVKTIEKYGLRHTRELEQLICKKGRDKDVSMKERLKLLNLHSKVNYSTLAKKAFRLVEMAVYTRSGSTYRFIIRRKVRGFFYVRLIFYICIKIPCFYHFMSEL